MDRKCNGGGWERYEGGWGTGEGDTYGRACSVTCTRACSARLANRVAFPPPSFPVIRELAMS